MAQGSYSARREPTLSESESRDEAAALGGQVGEESHDGSVGAGSRPRPEALRAVNGVEPNRAGEEAYHKSRNVGGNRARS